jgi:hypothetical protein
MIQFIQQLPVNSDAFLLPSDDEATETHTPNGAAVFVQFWANAGLNNRKQAWQRKI